MHISVHVYMHAYRNMVKQVHTDLGRPHLVVDSHLLITCSAAKVNGFRAGLKDSFFEELLEPGKGTPRS